MEERLRHLKILYVEDDRVHRQELADYLNRRVGKLYLAENGEQGLQKFESLKPDIILTDLRMPKVSGLDLAKAIRKTDKTIPIVVLTALSDKETILEAVRVGIIDYIIKPVDVKELMRVMVQAVETLSAIHRDFGRTHYPGEKLNELKKELTAYIKKETGKGPVDIRFEDDQGLTITVQGTLTRYEQALLEDPANRTMVEYSRKIFYGNRRMLLEEMVQKYSGETIELTEIVVNAVKDESELKFER